MTSLVELRRNIDADALAIGNLWREACQGLIESTRCYLECGQRLIDKKDGLAHGEWLPWLRANEEVLGFKDRAARLMIKAASNRQLTADLDETTAVAINRRLWGNTNLRGTQGTGENEWYTPDEYLAMARDVLGAIDLDPACSDMAQVTVRAARYFTSDDDGLKQDWHGRVWLNPPYAQPLIADFVSKMVAERRAGRVTAAVMLTHNYTDTAWFQEAAVAADAICFTRGRVRFINAEGEAAAPTQGQAFSYFGKNVGLFARVFATCGFVVVPWRA